jgi:hypothetical protein
MAQNTLAAQAPINVASLLAAPFKAVFRGLVAIAESNQQVREAQFLLSLSDEELAARGLKREDVVHHVFVRTYGY